MARFTLLTLALTLTAAAQAPKNDYADPLSGLCKPGRQDACAVDLTTTVAAADGVLHAFEKRTRQTPQPEIALAQKRLADLIRRRAQKREAP